MFNLTTAGARLVQTILRPPPNIEILHLGTFILFFHRNQTFGSHKDQYQPISCFDPNWFNEVLAAPEKVIIKFVSAAVNEIDSVTLKQEIIG